MLGLAAIGMALLKYADPARNFGWVCIFAGIYSLGGMFGIDMISRPMSFHPTPLVYLIMTVPSWLGAITLLVCHAYLGQVPSEDGKFSLIFLFYVIALAALFFGCCVFLDRFDFDLGP